MKEWDTAASYCIISEAGGKMTDMLGNDISYNNEDVFHHNGILLLERDLQMWNQTSVEKIELHYRIFYQKKPFLFLPM